MQTMMLETFLPLISRSKPLMPTGLPSGAITQICGDGKVEAALQILKDNPWDKPAWIESAYELEPLDIEPQNIDLTRILFTEVGEHMIRTCHQILESNLYSIVILKSAPLDDFLLHKLQLAAEKSQTALVLLTENFSASWPISLMLKAQKNKMTEFISMEVLRKCF